MSGNRDESVWADAERDGYAVTHPSLIDAAVRGDESAAHRFYRIYRPLIAKYAGERGFDDNDIEDIVQTVMIAFFKRANEDFRYDPGRRFRNYIYGITAHTVTDALRKRYRRDARFVSDSALDASAAGTDGATVPHAIPEAAKVAPSVEAEEAEWEEYLASVCARELRDRVKPVVWQVFDLLRQGVLPEEIRDLLGIGLSTVYEHRNRAREEYRRLQRELGERELLP